MNGNYTKHIYIGSQRIVSKLGDLDSYGPDPRRIEYAGSNVDGAKVDYATKYKALQQTIKDRYAKFEVEYLGKDNDDYVNGQGFCCDDSKTLKSFSLGQNDNPELYQYYYHSDHLGSSSLITNLDGEVVQHIEYVPFGEVFIEERNNTWNTPYLFNAKELDEETGLYYYGARYYDPRVSIWLSVDPLAEKYPGINTYAYSFHNPIKYVDPDGKDPITPLRHMIVNLFASRWTHIETSSVEWTNFDIIKWKTVGGNEYLVTRKLEFITHYNEVIKEAAALNGIPALLLAGVAYNEFGGDPMWIDDVAYETRNFDWSGPDWVDKHLTSTNEPDLTSFGNLSTQVRRAIKTLGYSDPTLEQKNEIIKDLKDPVKNIYIAAMHLKELQDVDFKGKNVSDLTEDDIKITATRFNRGPDASKESIKSKNGYGQAIYNRKQEIKNALNGD